MHEQTAAFIESTCPVDIFLSYSSGQITDWPHRLVSYDEASMTQRKHALTFLLDSGANGHGAATAELLDAAERLYPTHLMATDTIAESENRRWEAVVDTAKRVSDFIDRLESRSISPTLMIPLQPPHDEHYRYLQAEYPRQARQAYFAVGGLKNETAETQLEAIRALREEVGYQVNLHGLGFGSTETHITALTDNPALLDSLDLSTPQQKVANQELWGDATLPDVEGDYRLTIEGRYVVALTAHLAKAYSTLHSSVGQEYPDARSGGDDTSVATTLTEYVVGDD